MLIPSSLIQCLSNLLWRDSRGQNGTCTLGAFLAHVESFPRSLASIIHEPRWTVPTPKPGESLLLLPGCWVLCAGATTMHTVWGPLYSLTGQAGAWKGRQWRAVELGLERRGSAETRGWESSLSAHKSDCGREAQENSTFKIIVSIFAEVGGWDGKHWRRKWQPMSFQTIPSFLARRIPWTEEPGGLLFLGPQRVRHDWVTQHTRETEQVRDELPPHFHCLIRIIL